VTGQAKSGSFGTRSQGRSTAAYCCAIWWRFGGSGQDSLNACGVRPHAQNAKARRARPWETPHRTLDVLLKTLASSSTGESWTGGILEAPALLQRNLAEH